MTKEELRKEATFTVEWESTPMIDRPLFVHGYITGAEPREKRIDELEIENKRISTECHKLVETLEKKQKEIVELKEKVGKYQIGMFNEIEKRDKRLTKAEEVIKDQKELLDRVLSGAETLSDFAQNTLHKAEQFLNSEVEK